MEWNEIDNDVLSEVLWEHNMLALDIDNAREEGESTDDMWDDLEKSFDEAIEFYVEYVLGKNAKYFYKAFPSKEEAFSWVAELTDCCLNSIDEDRMIDFISEIRLVTYLSRKKGMTVRRAA
jgi:hypothetical protein